MIIAIDFDGTCVTHEYPKMGKDIGAIPVLKELIKNDHQLILFTMRSGSTLEDALTWFDDNDIDLWSVNLNPEQKSWTDSVCIQKVSDRSGLKLRDGFASFIH